MLENPITKKRINDQREKLFQLAESKLQFTAQTYPLSERFDGLTSELSKVIAHDVTQVPGGHYGLRNVFVPLIYYLESSRKSKIIVSPQTAILVEPSTGNGWIAFSDAAEMLGYEHLAVMPDGLPQSRYQHPAGRYVEIIKTPKQEYAVGMPIKLRELIEQNKQRLVEGKKIYVSPNHSAGKTDLTIDAMSELGSQLLKNLGQLDSPLRVVVSMGNGASVCALGEYVKKNIPTAKIVATESLAYGGGYDRFAQLKGLPSYRQLFGIDPGHPDLMTRFQVFGTNAPIGIELPLQTRAMGSDLIDDYVLFTDEGILQAYKGLNLNDNFVSNASSLPNYNRLPDALVNTYGNSTLANIAVASQFTNGDEKVVAMAYDSRKNY